MFKESSNMNSIEKNKKLLNKPILLMKYYFLTKKFSYQKVVFLPIFQLKYK